MSEKIPEDKTQRLASLNQDVFAVSSQPAPKAVKKKAVKQVERGRAPRPAEAPPPVATRAVAMAAEETPTALPHTLLIGVMVMAVLLVGGIGGGIVFGFSLWEKVALIETESAALSSSLGRLEQRVASLEGQLSAAEEDASNMGDDQQANILELTSRLRQLARDMTRSTTDLTRLRDRVGSVASMAERANSATREQSSQIAALASQIANLPAPAVAPAAAPTPAPLGPVTDEQARAQIQTLQARLDTMANDIRGIYRLLEQSR